MNKIIAHAVHSYLGLSETFIYEYLIELNRYKPIVVTDNLQNLNLFPFKNILSNSDIKLYSFWWLFNHILYRVQPKDFFENKAFFESKLKKNKARLIHAHFGHQGIKMLPVKHKLKIPLVTTFYGYDLSELPKIEKWKAAYQKLFDQGDLFLVEGPFMKKKLEQLGCPSEKIKIQKIGIRLSKHTFKTRSIDLSKDKIILLFCGRFTEKKGLIPALLAFEKVVYKFPNIEFRIIGDGEQRDNINKIIYDIKLADKITMLGYQTHPVVLSEMQKAHILIQPSQTAENGDSEGGAPTVLLEAQASGLPIITTNHADIPNIISKSHQNYMAPERNVEKIAQNLSQLIINNKFWEEIGIAGRKFVEEHHNIINLVQQLENRYDALFD